MSNQTPKPDAYNHAENILMTLRATFEPYVYDGVTLSGPEVLALTNELEEALHEVHSMALELSCERWNEASLRDALINQTNEAVSSGSVKRFPIISRSLPINSLQRRCRS